MYPELSIKCLYSFLLVKLKMTFLVMEKSHDIRIKRYICKVKTHFNQLTAGSELVRSPPF